MSYTTVPPGRALSSARAVCCSSLGGQVLLPHPLMATGPAEALRSSLAPLLLYVGDAELQVGDVPYCAASRMAFAWEVSCGSVSRVAVGALWRCT